MSAPPTGMGERLAALTGNRPWWPLVEPSPRRIRVRLGDELVADSRSALLYVQYGPGDLPPTFLPTYFVPPDDIVPGSLVDFHAQGGRTTWTVQAGGRRAEGAAWAYAEPPAPRGTRGGGVRGPAGAARDARRNDHLLLGLRAHLVRGGRAAVRPRPRPAQAGGR